MVEEIKEEKSDMYGKQLFDTHKFFFTLNYDGDIGGQKVIFLDRNNIEITIILERIEVGTSPVSCKLYCKDGNRYLVPFIRIRKVFNQRGELIWDNTDADLSDVKIIKGFK